MTADPQATTFQNRKVGSDLDGVGPGHLVNRPVTSLRPLQRYLELRRPVVPRAEGSGSLRVHAMREPLLVTTTGTILDGHVRWQVALVQHRSSLPCLEYDLTDEEALEFVVERHRTSSHLNDFCRIVLALPLESYFKRRNPRMRGTDGGNGRSSKLTNVDRTDVRADIARVAGVSAGNVTKVKQLLKSVIPEIQEHLRRREVSIHKAWQWRTLSAKGQRDALWEHLHHGAIKKTVGRLVKAHADSGIPVQPVDVAATVLHGLAMYGPADLTVAVVDVPGRAVVVTRACYDELQEKHTR